MTCKHWVYPQALLVKDSHTHPIGYHGFADVCSGMLLFSGVSLQQHSSETIQFAQAFARRHCTPTTGGVQPRRRRIPVGMRGERTGE